MFRKLQRVQFKLIAPASTAAAHFSKGTMLFYAVEKDLVVTIFTVVLIHEFSRGGACEITQAFFGLLTDGKRNG